MRGKFFLMAGSFIGYALSSMFLHMYIAAIFLIALLIFVVMFLKAYGEIRAYGEPTIVKRMLGILGGELKIDSSYTLLMRDGEVYVKYKNVLSRYELFLGTNGESNPRVIRKIEKVLQEKYRELMEDRQFE